MNPDDQQQLTAIYQTYVQGILSHEDKRQKTHQFYLGLMTLLIGLYPLWDQSITMLLNLLLIFISVSWLIKILYFRQLSQSKFFALNKIEEQLSAQPYRDEWQHFKSKKFQLELTWLEMLLPVMVLVGSSFWLIKQLITA